MVAPCFPGWLWKGGRKWADEGLSKQDIGGSVSPEKASREEGRAQGNQTVGCHVAELDVVRSHSSLQGFCLGIYSLGNGARTGARDTVSHDTDTLPPPYSH